MGWDGGIVKGFTFEHERKYGDKYFVGIVAVDSKMKDEIKIVKKFLRSEFGAVRSIKKFVPYIPVDDIVLLVPDLWEEYDEEQQSLMQYAQDFEESFIADIIGRRLR